MISNWFKRLNLAAVLLLTSNLFFLLLFLTLSYNNRLALDDFHFLGNLKAHGIGKATWLEYQTWNCRWTSLMLNHFVLALNERTKSGLLLFGVTNLFLFISGVYFLLVNVLNFCFSNTCWSVCKTGNFKKGISLLQLNPFKSENLINNNWARLNLSIFIVSALFITTIKIDETWFWLCAVCTYLWSAMALVYGVAFIINPKRDKIFATIGCFSFLYIGGALGPLSVMVLFVLTGLIIYNLTKHTVSFIDNQIFLTRLVLALVFCLGAFVVLYLGPGNRKREAFFEVIDVGTALILNFKMTGIIVLKRLPLIAAYTVIFCSPALYFGYTLKKRITSISLKTNLLWLTILYGFIIYGYQFAITFKTQDVAAYRALFPITLLTIAYVLCVYCLIGRVLIRLKYYFKLIPTVVTISSCVIFINLFYRQQIVSANYASSYDKRMYRLKNTSNNISKLELLPLASSGLLISAEISTDTNSFINLHLRKGLGLNYSVKLVDTTSIFLSKKRH